MLISFCCLFWPAGISLASDIETANLIADGYEANRKSIRLLNCYFHYRNGLANAASNVLSGDYKKTGEQSGHWVVKEDAFLYTLECTSESKRNTQLALNARVKAGRNEIILVPCLESYRLASNDGYSLIYSPEISGANLLPPTQEVPPIEFSPFTLAGAMTSGGESVASPSSLLRLAIAAKRVFSISSITENGDQFFDVNIDGKDEEMDIYFRVHPARGFLPTKFVLTSHKSKIKECEAAMLDAKQLSNGIWIPIRSVNVQKPDGPAPFYVYDIEVMEVHEDVKGVDLGFPIPKSVQIGVRGEDKWFDLEENRTVFASDLSDLYNEASARSIAFSPDEPESIVKQSQFGIDTLTVANGVAIILLGASIVYRMKRKLPA